MSTTPTPPSDLPAAAREWYSAKVAHDQAMFGSADALASWQRLCAASKGLDASIAALPADAVVCERGLLIEAADRLTRPEDSECAARLRRAAGGSKGET